MKIILFLLVALTLAGCSTMSPQDQERWLRASQGFLDGVNQYNAGSPHRPLILPPMQYYGR
jgi:hypothetical protein